MRLFARLPLVALALSAACSLSLAKSPAEWQALLGQAQITLPQAVEKAQQVTPGSATEVSLDDGDGQGLRYEVDIVTPNNERVEVWVNAATGQAAPHKNKGAAKRKTMTRLREAKLNLSQALQAASGHTPGTLLKAELDSHRGQAIYEVKVLQAGGAVMKLKINAATGEIISTQPD